jgi:hypothetical protein
VKVFSERALVLDRQGVIAWSYCSPIAVNPGADGILDALEKLSNEANSHGQLENADHAKRSCSWTGVGTDHARRVRRL